MLRVYNLPPEPTFWDSLGSEPEATAGVALWAVAMLCCVALSASGENTARPSGTPPTDCLVIPHCRTVTPPQVQALTEEAASAHDDEATTLQWMQAP